jgi:CMP/dCMP kinase
MHISITGDLGSGKSTVAKILCEKLDYAFLSTGMIQRQLAQAQGMDTLEFNKYSDHNKQVDDYIDQHLKDINEGEEPYVLDSRLAWFFIPKSFKVYLLAFDKVAAERILADKNRIGEPNADDVNKKIKDSHERRASENNRFEKTYGAKFDLHNNFDLIVDTSDAGIDDVAAAILNAYAQWRNGEAFCKMWFSAKRLLPLQSVSDAQASVDATSKAIEVVMANNKYFIYSNYATYIQALQQQLKLVATHCIARDGDVLPNGQNVQAYIAENFSAANISAWQDTFGIVFPEA